VDISSWPWVALGLLGVYHGLNPAMGWLFAVALGFQRGSRGAVIRSLMPIALGHEASVALVVLLSAACSSCGRQICSDRSAPSRSWRSA